MTAIKTATARKVAERDRWTCIFCEQNYRMEKADEFGKAIKDIMHFIPRSQGGKGIEENLAVGCRYHHQMLDNGKDGHRREMLQIFENHLRYWYSDWKKDELVFRKGEE